MLTREQISVDTLREISLKIMISLAINLLPFLPHDASTISSTFNSTSHLNLRLVCYWWIAKLYNAAFRIRSRNYGTPKNRCNQNFSLFISQPLVVPTSIMSHLLKRPEVGMGSARQFVKSSYTGWKSYKHFCFYKNILNYIVFMSCFL